MRIDEHIDAISLALKDIERAVDKIQMYQNQLEEEHVTDAKGFVVLSDFRESMNRSELAFYEVRKAFEERLDNEEM